MVANIASIDRVAHREDYHAVLLDAARKVGAEIRLGSMVKTVNFETTEVILVDGSVVKGDIIVGADGTWYRCDFLTIEV